LYCEKGYFYGCQDLITLGPRWYLCTLRCDVCRPQFSESFVSIIYTEGRFSNIVKTGRLKMWGDESLFLMGNFRSYRGVLDIVSSWSREEIAYRAKKTSVFCQVMNDDDCVHISVAEGAVTYKLTKAYVRYPLFSYYDLSYQSMIVYYFLSGQSIMLMKRYYGVIVLPHDVLALKKEKQSLLTVKMGIEYYTVYEFSKESAYNYDSYGYYGKLTFVRNGYLTLRDINLKLLFNFHIKDAG